MEKSIFFIWLKDRLNPLISRLVQKLNGDKGNYLFKQWFTEEYSVDMKWGSLGGTDKPVMADAVALDSSLPIKSREAIQTQEGDIPKLGLIFNKRESEMQQIQMMEATNANGKRTQQIINKIFNHSKKAVKGIYERWEYMAYEALSTGYAVLSQDDNEGIAIRVNYGISDSNRYGVATKWSDAAAKPITDINRIIAEADEDSVAPNYMLMDKFAFNNFVSKQEVRELYAASIGFAGANIPTPNKDQINGALLGQGLPVIVIMDRSFKFEKNGNKTSLKPWAKGVVTFAPSLDFGRLVWTDLVETNNPAKDVLYSLADSKILVSVYHTKNPFSEITSGQALGLPVLDGVDSIYLLDTEDAVTDAQTEADANFDYNGVSYTVASVVAGLNATNEVPESTTSQTDATLLKKINKLSDAGVEIFEAELVTSI